MSFKPKTKNILIISAIFIASFVFTAKLTYAQTQPSQGKDPNFDGTGVVGFKDFFMFGNAWGTSNAQYDLNDDAIVDAQDLILFIGWFGKEFIAPEPQPLPPEPEPEPPPPSISSSTNTKKQSAYRNKEVFLASSQNWQDVLSLTPATTWTAPVGHDDLNWCNILKDENGNDIVYDEFDAQDNPIQNKVCAYPTLVWHDETDLQNLDPIINPELEKLIRSSLIVADWNYIMPVHQHAKKKCPAAAYPAIPYPHVQFTGFAIEKKDTLNFGESIWVDITMENCADTAMDYSAFKPVKLSTNKNSFVSWSSVQMPSSLESGATATLRFIMTYNKELFDMESALLFVEQYNAQNVTVVGNNPQTMNDFIVAHGVSAGNIREMDSSLAIEFWDTSSALIVVNDYKHALIASVYASFINVPIIIIGSSLDIESTYQGKTVVCIGENVNPSSVSCAHTYTIAQIQDLYAQQTNTNKIALVNSNDFSIKHHSTEGNAFKNNVIFSYTKDSLGAPILASARHELIVFSEQNNFQAADSAIEYAVNNILAKKAEFLTIVASPLAIDYALNTDGFGNRYSYDQWDYARVDEDNFLDLAVGRIMGFTVSDSSSSIARSLFYSDILSNDTKMLYARGDKAYNLIKYVHTIGKAMQAIGYDATIDYSGTNPESWENKFYISFKDHGHHENAGINSGEVPRLDATFLTLNACLPCDFIGAQNFAGDDLTGNLFCMDVIRQGASGVVAAVDEAQFTRPTDLGTHIFANGLANGQALRNMLNANIARRSAITSDYIEDSVYTLIGDPVLRIRRKFAMPQISIDKISSSSNSATYRATVPTLKIDVPQYIKDAAKTPSRILDAYLFNPQLTQFIENPGYFMVPTDSIDTSMIVHADDRDKCMFNIKRDSYYSEKVWVESHNFSDLRFEVPSGSVTDPDVRCTIWPDWTLWPHYSGAQEGAFTDYTYEFTLVP